MVIVFDFDGTLADSLEVMLGIYNELAESRDLRRVTPEDWEQLRMGTIAQGIKWIGIKPFQIPGLLTQGLRMVEPRTADIKLFPAIIPVVQELAAEGHTLFVLSTNSQKVIQEVLNKHGIGEEMTVLKSSKVFGKASALKKLVKTNQVEPSSVMMIGDEVRDMVAAKKAGVRPVGVNWGFQPGDTLAALGGVTLIRTPEELLKLVNKER